jgi:hypothetical protein
MWAFLASPIGRWLGIAVSVLVLAGGFYGLARHSGVVHEQKAETKRTAQATAQVVRHEQAAAQVSTASAQHLIDEKARIETVTKVLIRKVPVYVTAKADAACVVPRGFVRVFDAAGRGEAEVPGSSGGPDDAASGVPLSAVLSTVVANDGVAYDWRAEALTWRDWYTKQAAAWNK